MTLPVALTKPSTHPLIHIRGTLAASKNLKLTNVRFAG